MLAIPVIMCFVPGGVELAKAGFANLETLPQWYQYTLVTIILASFGIRNKEAISGLFKNTLKRK